MSSHQVASDGQGAALNINLVPSVRKEFSLLQACMDCDYPRHRPLFGRALLTGDLYQHVASDLDVEAAERAAAALAR